MKFRFKLRTLLILPIVIAFVMAAITTATKQGMVDWHYTVIVDNAALSAPIRVVEHGTNYIGLEDGRLVQITESSFDRQRTLAIRKVDVEPLNNSPSEVVVFCDSSDLPPTCGGCVYNDYIRIPIIPRNVNRNHRFPIFVGVVIDSETEHGPTR